MYIWQKHFSGQGVKNDETYLYETGHSAGREVYSDHAALL
jgi:hypothetical protein